MILFHAVRKNVSVSTHVSYHMSGQGLASVCIMRLPRRPVGLTDRCMISTRIFYRECSRRLTVVGKWFIAWIVLNPIFNWFITQPVWSRMLSIIELFWSDLVSDIKAYQTRLLYLWTVIPIFLKCGGLPLQFLALGGVQRYIGIFHCIQSPFSDKRSIVRW